MHTVFALLCFVVVIHWLIFPYPSGLLHWHCGNLTIAPVPAKQPWWIWINTSCEFIMNDCITTTKQNTTKPCAYFLGYTVHACSLVSIAENDIISHIPVTHCIIRFYSTPRHGANDKLDYLWWYIYSWWPSYCFLCTFQWCFFYEVLYKVHICIIHDPVNIVGGLRQDWLR